MSRNVVGIHRGMGPEATILLQQRFLAAVQSTDDTDHLPLLIDVNAQAPSRITHLIEGTGIDAIHQHSHMKQSRPHGHHIP
jgi:aspartate racemase